MSEIKYVAVERPHPPIHCMPYGEAGAGKTEFAISFPKPILFQCFDPHGKDGPVLRAGRPSDLYNDPETGMMSRLVYGKASDEVIIKVEYYLDLDPENPVAWDNYCKRMRRFVGEWNRWGTIVADSVTFAEMTARWYSEFKANRTNNDGRAHYGYSAKQLELNLISRLAAIPTNVVVPAHVEKDKDQGYGPGSRALYNPLAPGQMSKKFPSGYAELYRLYVDEKGQRVIQTVPDMQYNAATQIGVPDRTVLPRVASYEALWKHTTNGNATR